MGKQPAFQFYPGDWMKDPDLRICSHFARGLLVDLLCAMFEAKHRGRLCNADGVTPWTRQQIVGLSSGGDESQKLAALEELIANGVLKLDAKGVVFSARMVRDEQIRSERAKAGSKGGSKTQANHQANNQANIKQNTEDEDEDEDESLSTEKEGAGRKAPSEQYPADFERFWSAYRSVRKTAKGDALKAWKQVTRDADPEVIIAAAREYGESPMGTSEYGKLPASWLRQKCWDDDRQAWQGKRGAEGTDIPF